MAHEITSTDNRKEMLVSNCLEGNTSETGYIHEQSEWMCPDRDR